jgi:hypothetical protein
MTTEREPSMSDETNPLIVQMPGFDEDYYRSHCPDAADHEGSALDHYLNVGWKAGINPSKGFDGNAYLAINTDVREADICPLVHFLNYGLAEGRAFSQNS